jgi:hypothetical protein
VAAIYTTAYSAPQFLIRGRAQTIEMRIRADGAAVTVASGTVTVKNGTAIVVGPTPITSIGVGGQAQFVLAASLVPDSESFSQWWSVQWDLVVGADTLPPIVRDAHLVFRPLPPVIDAQDILDRVSTLSRQFTLAQAQVKVDIAYDDMIERLLGDGRFPQKVMTAWSFRAWHRALSMSHLYDQLAAHGVAAQYDKDQQKWEGRAEKAWGDLNWKADRDEDGTDDGTTEAASPAIFLHERPGWGLRF